MASNEKAFQNEMVEATRDAGGFCWKMSSMSKNGIPDLFVTHPRLSGWIECKFVNAMNGMQWTLKTTDLQKKRIKELHLGSSVAGWAVCVKVSNRRWTLYTGVHENKKFCANDYYGKRDAGEKWDVIDILRDIESKQAKAQWQD